MANHGSKRFPTHHGYGEVRVSRYLVLYMGQIAWFVLGAYLFATAFWPSSCAPDGLWKMLECSILLPESGGWSEAGLLTWIWSTPILVMLELSRRWNKGKE